VIPTFDDYFAALPEILLLGMTSFILILDLFLKDHQRNLTYLLTQFTLLLCAVVTVFTVQGRPVFAFNGLVVDDLMSDVLKVMIYLAVTIALVYVRAYNAARGLFTGEFFALALFATLGMLVMVSADHFLTLYIGLELLSLSLYAMVALQRDSARATEAAMKYFVLGALASGMLLYGMSMFYGATGSLELESVSAGLAGGLGSSRVLVFGLVFIVAGIAFKLGVVPFHMWVPDVYQGAPTSVTLFIASAPKIAAFAFTLRLLVNGLEPLVADWHGMLVVLAVLSMVLGNVVAIAQTNLKRMLAYSTISHMGFVLLGVLSGSLNGYASAMFYVLVYVLTALAGFGVLLLLSREGFESEELDDLKGLNRRDPWFAFIMLLVMFSMAGVPPLAGFFAKLSVLQAALQQGLVWLVVLAVMMSLVGAFYYLRVVKLMYFDDPQHHQPIQPLGDMKVMLSANGVGLLLLGLAPQPLLTLCMVAISHSM
jgi:NADH-quinone oxidoreductase subunit N